MKLIKVKLLVFEIRVWNAQFLLNAVYNAVRTKMFESSTIFIYLSFKVIWVFNRKILRYFLAEFSKTLTIKTSLNFNKPL